MIRLGAGCSVEFRGGLLRRDFLQAGSLPLIGAGLPKMAAWDAMDAEDSSRSERNCILSMLAGGPSQLDAWDMMPNAPAEIRGHPGVTPIRELFG